MNKIRPSRASILFVSTMAATPWGGSEELWSAAARILLQKGFAIAICTRSWDPIPGQVRELEALGGELYPRKWDTIPSRIARKLRDPIRAILNRTSPDLVVISQGNNDDGMSWMEQCLEAGMKYVAVAQAAVPWYWPNDDAVVKLRRVYLAAAKAYFVSHENLHLTERQLACDLGNARLIRNPSRVPYETDLQWPNHDDTARLACVGRLDGYVKGHDILFDVLSQKKWRERPLRLTLYGSGSNEGSFRATCDKMGLRNVSFAGFVEDPLEIWRNEHALVLPSRAEGLPVAIVEAMLCARPCIVSNASGNPELLKDDVTGFISDGSTVTAVDNAMERAWQARSRWREIGEAAAASVRAAVPPDPAGVLAESLLEILN